MTSPAPRLRQLARDIDAAAVALQSMPPRDRDDIVARVRSLLTREADALAAAPTPPSDGVSFVLLMRAESRDALNREPAQRLRRLLKFALRDCGLRCVSVSQTDDIATPGREAAHVA